MPDLTRRQAVKLLAWTVPVVVTLDVSRADAVFRHSEPPRPPEHRQTFVSPAPAPAMGPALAPALTGQLPYTGNNEAPEVVAGVLALCAGFALVARGHEPRQIT